MSTYFDNNACNEMWDDIAQKGIEERNDLFMDFHPIQTIINADNVCDFVDDWQVQTI